MREEEIREKFQREDENDLRGRNVEAINRFIEMLDTHEKSEDKNIRSIAENFECIEKVAPNFAIFQGKDCLFMHNFKAYQISENTDMLVASHEFGHCVLSTMNDTKVPQNYMDVISKAKQYALEPENKEFFKSYIQYLAGKTENKEDRTAGEKGPLSDIISSIFQLQGLRINSSDNVCMFPSSHTREYYYDEENKKPRIDKIFDEDFANYYALKSQNCIKEIETLKTLFGDELIEVLESQLENVSEKFIKVKDSKNEKEQIDVMEQIKNVVSVSKKSEIDSIESFNILKTKNTQEREYGRVNE